MAEKKETMLTAAKWAGEFGVSPAKIKKLIEELNIEPDLVKGNCKYYTEETAKGIKEKLG